MTDSHHSIGKRLAETFAGRQQGPLWRLATWWPNDSRRSQHRSLLQLLAVAHTERLDPAPLVANLAEEHRGRGRRQLRRLARRLEEGTSLVDAIEQTPDVLDDAEVLMIRFATQTGTLDSAYRHLESRRDDDAFSQSQPYGWQDILIYTVFMLGVLILASSFLLIFIVPTMESISDEMQFEMSRPLSLFITIGQFVSDYSALLILAGVLTVCLVGSGGFRRFWRRRVSSFRGKSVADGRTAELLRLLSMAVEGGRPLPAALSTLARYHFDPFVRGRLLYARNEVEQGADPWHSLGDAQLLSAREASALAGLSCDASRAWAMRKMAFWKTDSNESSRRLRLTGLQNIILFLFAAAVLLIGFAILGYLARLTELLS